MKLLKLLDGINYSGNASNVTIASITHDSRKVKDGTLFIALKGSVSDGYDYIKDAVENGASAILANSRKVDIDTDIPVLNVSNVRKSMSKIASNFFEQPSERLNMVGVTGTNGKTSVCYLINQILNEHCLSSGSIGTLGYINSSNIISTGFTTPESIDLQQILHTSINGGLKNIVMEVSSHSLEMHRVDDVHINIAVFTNLTPEHLDFHKTMNSYLKAKQKLFNQLDEKSFAVINIDDPYSKDITLKSKAKIITYGLSSNSDIYPLSYNFSKDKIIAKISVLGKEISIETTLIGKYNLYNLLASISTAFLCGVSLNKIEKSLNKPISIPGRLEIVYNQNGKTIIIDYAHTPDAFKNVLQSITHSNYKNIITIFGCGGDRDISKRQVMASIAEKYSSKVIITSDNPRSEDINKIFSDIKLGFENNNYIEIPDRREALLHAINELNPGSVLIVLGKGVESYQEINGERIPYNEKEIILEAVCES